MITLLSQLSTTKLELYDQHFEMVLKAIKSKDLVTLNQFYSVYDIGIEHPLRMVIERLIEPDFVVIDKPTTFDVYNPSNEIIGKVENGVYHDIQNQQ